MHALELALATLDLEDRRRVDRAMLIDIAAGALATSPIARIVDLFAEAVVRTNARLREHGGTSEMARVFLDVFVDAFRDAVRARVAEREHPPASETN